MMVNKPYMDAMDREGTTATATDVCQCWPHLLSFSFSSFSAIGVGITWQLRIDSVEKNLLKFEERWKKMISRKFLVHHPVSSRSEV